MGVHPRGKKWIARVHLGGGEYKHLGTFPTEKLAQDEFDAWTEGRPRSRVSASDFARRWVDEFPRASESTNNANAYAIERFAQDFEGAMLRGPLNKSRFAKENGLHHEPDRVVAKAWAKENGWVLGAARAMYNDARDLEIVERNPFEKLGIGKGRGRRDLEVLSEEQVDSLAEAAYERYGASYGPTGAALVYLAAYEGLRAGELCGLRFRDVDFKRETIFVCNQRTTVGLDKEPKGYHKAEIALLPKARDALLALPRRPDQNYVLLGPMGGPLSPKSSLYSIWNPIRNTAGLHTVSPHQLRHFCATYIFELTRDMEFVSSHLRHRDASALGSLARKLYTHPSQARAVEEIRTAAKGKVSQLRSVPDASQTQTGSSRA